MVTRRDVLLGAPPTLLAASLAAKARAQSDMGGMQGMDHNAMPTPPTPPTTTTPTPTPTTPSTRVPGARAPAHKHATATAGGVVVPDGAILPWKMVDGAKQFHLIAEPVRREIAPGLFLNGWGYNGVTPGPVIEATEGDHVRILVTNRLPEPTSVHWHGVILPNGMDGVGGLTQPHIGPGETYAYEFTLRQHGTQMYHPHVDENVQMSMGMMGFFIIHPKRPRGPRIDRDFCIFLQEWALPAGGAVPNPSVMLDFSHFTFNGKAFPSTSALVVKLGERVRVRIGNLTMDSHPIHLHGHTFLVTGSDGGRWPVSAHVPESTVNVPVGACRDFEFVADNPGDWPLHCHKVHHLMNGMGHDLPNMLGVDTRGVTEKIRQIVPSYMPMGVTGMAGMMQMPAPQNTTPMMAGDGPFGPMEMGGMFTVMKIREGITSYDDPGWYRHPPGTVAKKVG